MHSAHMCRHSFVLPVAPEARPQGLAAIVVGAPAQCYIGRTIREPHMPKGEQRSNKMTKKPKKDNSPPKESTSSGPVPPPATAVLPQGKMKNKS